MERRLEIKSVPIDTLREDERNVRRHPSENIAAIKKSLEMYGQQKPIVVTDDGQVVAGNGTLRAAKELHWSKINVVITDLSGTAISAFAIADNRTTDLSYFDKSELLTLIDKIMESEGEIPGFDESAIAELEAWVNGPSGSQLQDSGIDEKRVLSKSLRIIMENEECFVTVRQEISSLLEAHPDWMASIES